MRRETTGRVTRVQIYHLDRQRRVATLLGQIINYVITRKIQIQQTSYPLMSHAFVMQHSVFTKINHHPLSATS